MSDSGQEGVPETAAEGIRAIPKSEESETQAETSEDVQQDQEQEQSEQLDQPEQPEQRIAALEEETSDLKDQLLRKQADFENFRKRIARE